MEKNEAEKWVREQAREAVLKPNGVWAETWRSYERHRHPAAEGTAGGIAWEESMLDIFKEQHNQCGWDGLSRGWRAEDAFMAIAGAALL